ncbi:3-methyl-2-oxobutanoate hydroxymethyltransferase [Tabrizicola oligotrophica]|uniref:3-methyl-2-oxobutanoate hydroxymethyltransferase n=1 Tax=Tabrizicola oligotrophica TaxID=2710650 RepID=A0A6M0QTL6_9RHOB|nr:3-methyl-2-oxobutanoate hydroxymethyltransferase [Tabrizicola oligotrophica]NEY90816.1 3-methyl-2-oxobutanoate hydroxymethyltransferase [Tabrizicola oligotrophica]
MTAKTNVHDLLAAKGKRKWVQLHVDSAAEAAAAEAAGIVILSCEADHTLAAVRAAAPSAFISAGMPHGAAATPDEALRLAFDALRRGADAIYSSHSSRFIEAMAREGIPVTGHVGLVPNLAAWTGFRAIGRKADEALQVLRKAKDIENAGAACLEVEVVPVQLADHITRTTPMLTMGMGCGAVCDTQYLFSCDVLGSNTGHYPRHSKRYADFALLEAELQAARVAAFRDFAADVERAGYPERRHEIWMEAAEAEAFARAAERI